MNLRKLVAALLCVFIISSLLPISASALDSFTGGNLVVAHPGFPDVGADDWYASDVSRLAGLGIIAGFPDGLFHPDWDVTIAEFVKLITVALGVDRPSGSLRLFPGHWASERLTIAYERGILTDADLELGIDPDRSITRSEMTKMMILALGIEPARIDDPFTDVSDIYSSTAYNEYLLRGYLTEAGRVWRGADNATRGEAATIIGRVIDYRSDAYAYKKAAIIENASQNVLTTELELIDLFYVLNREFMTSFTFRTSVSTRVLRTAYERSNVINLEYFYSSSASIRTSADEVSVITLGYSPDTESLRALHTAAEARAQEIVAGVILPSMTEEEKIKALHDYLVLNCEYDYDGYESGEIPFESHIAYGALVDKRAVCQGYCAAFALLCEYAGVRCAIVGGYAPNSQDAHAWNMVLVGGVIYYIDVTHDDPVPDRKGTVSYRYYALTESEMLSYGYSWDRASSNVKYFY